MLLFKERPWRRHAPDDRQPAGPLPGCGAPAAAPGLRRGAGGQGRPVRHQARQDGQRQAQDPQPQGQGQERGQCDGPSLLVRDHHPAVALKNTNFS